MLVIRLIGRPRLERDGEAIVGARGNKSWALLGRLLRSDEPPSRQRLVTELFSEADDPMGAMRWSLAELRRRTGLTDAFKENPVSTALGDDTIVDVHQTASGVVPEAIPVGEFLEGIEIKGSAGFETWLLVERQRVDRELLSALRQATLRALSGRQHETAVALAAVMIQRAPFDEGPHILLIKALATSGDSEAALRQVATSEAVFRDDLGVEPSGAIRAAARPSVASPVPGVSSRASAETLREAGLDALSAGAADAGIECLRGATAASETAGDPTLFGECLMELGTALVHSIRGYDDEGSVILDHAVRVASAAGSELTVAKALSELAYVDMLAGRRFSATQNLRAAAELATQNPSLVAALAGFEAMNLSDWGRIDDAVERFAEAVELSRSAGAIRREAWSRGLGARSLFLQGRLDEAADWARQSCELAREDRWPAFRPWPEAWACHARIARGEDPRTVREQAEATFALARQLQDPCWEGIAAKTVGLTYAAEGRHQAALGWLENASTLCRRVTDSYTWVEAEILIAEAETAASWGDRDRAESTARRAMVEAARGSMDGLLARARQLCAAA